MWTSIIVGLVITAVSIGARLIANALRTKETFRFEIDRPQADESAPIPVIFGTVNMKKPNCVWYGDEQSYVRDGERKYKIGLHLVLCNGNIDLIYGINYGGKRIWPTINPSSSSYYPHEYIESAWGPDITKYTKARFEDLGIIESTVKYYDGTDTQTQNTYLQEKIGNDDIPAYLGISSLVFEEFELGLSPSLKTIDIMVQRIFMGEEGLEQWYPEKAAIPTISDPEIVPFYGALWEVYEREAPGNLSYFHSDWFVSWVDRYDKFNIYYGELTPISQNLPIGSIGTSGMVPPYSIVNTWSPNTCKLLKKEITITGRHDVILDMYYEDGLIVFFDEFEIYYSKQELDDEDVVKHHMAAIPANIATKGTHTITVLVYDEIVDYGSGDSTYFTMRVFYRYFNSMNPAHIIRECLTNSKWGMSKFEHQIIDSEFKDAADILYDEEMGLCLEWDRQNDIKEFINDILRQIGGELRIDRSSGRFGLKLIRDDYTISELPILDESNINKITNFKKPALSELINEVTINYTDLLYSKPASITIQDTALVFKQGGIISKTVEYAGIVTAVAATQIARRDVAALVRGPSTCTIYVNSDASSLNIGDVFKLTFPDYGYNETIMRIGSMTLNNDKKRTIQINCTEDVYAMPTGGLIMEAPPDAVPQSQTAYDIVHSIVYEQPYYELVAEKGQSTVTALLAVNPDASFLATAGRQPTTPSIYAKMYVNPGTSYVYEGDMDFCPLAFVDEPGLSFLDTTINMYGDWSFSNVVVGSFLMIDDEIMSVVSIVDETEITVKRAVLDTVPAEHATGSRIYFYGNYHGSDITERNSTDELDVKLLTVTLNDELDINSASVRELTLNGRGIRPYPPADVKVEGLYFPSNGFGGDLTLTWVARNRLNLNVLDFTDSGETAESNTTYSINIRDTSTLELLDTFTGISALTYDIPNIASYNKNDLLIELFSVRDGFESLYKVQIIVNVVDVRMSSIGGVTFLTDNVSKVSSIGGVTFLTDNVSKVSSIGIVTFLKPSA